MTLENDITNAVRALQKGQLILYPTDTVWGIGCDATNEDAVQKIFHLKKRADSKSMIILLENNHQIKDFCEAGGKEINLLINFGDRPTTFIYPGGKNLARNVIAEDGTVALRIANDLFCKELLRRFNKPLISTSANKSGHSPPVFFKEIENDIIAGVSYIVHHRQDDRTIHAPSRIVKLEEDGKITILRS